MPLILGIEAIILGTLEVQVRPEPLGPAILSGEVNGFNDSNAPIREAPTLETWQEIALPQRFNPDGSM